MRWSLLAILLTASCVYHTEPEKRNAGAITDLAAAVDDKGVEAGSKLSGTLARAAATNEKAVGAPEERIDVSSLDAVEDNRKEADKAVEGRGGWIGWAIGGVAGLEVVLRLLGMGGIAGSLAEGRKWLEEKQAKV